MLSSKVIVTGLNFFEKQIAVKDAKERDHNERMADQALQTLTREREKFDQETDRANHAHELHLQEPELTQTLDAKQALLLVQNQTASYERRERHEVIKDCQRNKMSIPDIKEFLALIFPDTE